MVLSADANTEKLLLPRLIVPARVISCVRRANFIKFAISDAVGFRVHRKPMYTVQYMYTLLPHTARDH